MPRCAIFLRGERLSCSALIQGDLVIDVPQDTVINAQVVRKAADERVIARDTAVHMCYVEVDEPDMHKPLGDLDRLKAAIAADWKQDNLEVDFHLIPQVQSILRKGEWKVTAAIHRDHEEDRPRLIALYPGLKIRSLWHRLRYRFDDDRHASLFVAVGPHGGIRGCIQSADPLRRRSDEPRLHVMMNPDGRGAMTNAVREALNGLIDKVCADGGVSRQDIL